MRSMSSCMIPVPRTVAAVATVAAGSATAPPLSLSLSPPLPLSPSDEVLVSLSRYAARTCSMTACSSSTASTCFRV